jgi:hypothetical protein
MQLSKQLKNSIFFLLILVCILGTCLAVVIAQKGAKTKTPQELFLDSIVNSTIKRNETAIVKRVGELKSAEKKCDSLTQVVTELKQEINEKTNNDDDGIDVGNAQLLPISKDKSH